MQAPTSIATSRKCCPASRRIWRRSGTSCRPGASTRQLVPERLHILREAGQHLREVAVDVGACIGRAVEPGDRLAAFGLGYEEVVERQAERLRQSTDLRVAGVDELTAALGDLAVGERGPFGPAAPAHPWRSFEQGRAQAGLRASLLEGSPRVGGRCWTERSAFADGQIAERGGELIDTSHAQIRALAQSFGLPLDDLLVAQPKGSEPVAWFDGAAYASADINRDFAQVLPGLTQDMEALGDELPTWRKHTAARPRAPSYPA